MTITTWFRRRSCSAAAQSRSRRLVSGFRPRLEILEDRLAPATSSLNVAIIGSPDSVNGGALATQGPAYASFNFTNLAPADVNAANLANYDTVVLNVASPEVQSSPLSAQAKAALVSFAGSGHKMIIYDSELPAVDYSWLPFPFSTNNPGANGANGTLSIVENSTLASNVTTDPKYIDAGLIASTTDAVGDSNVFTTQNPNWYIVMSATNVNGVTGAMTTYAPYSNPGSATTGLFIYNGMDIDYLGSSTQPDTTTGAGNLAKIWLQELQQPFNPDGLPGGVSAVGISLNSATKTLNVGESHTVTATISNNLGQPQPGVPVSFKILSGPNAGLTGTVITNTLGEASFTYTGSGGVGTDEIQASYVDDAGQTVNSRIVSAAWSNSCGATITPPSAPDTPQQISAATQWDGLLGFYHFLSYQYLTRQGLDALTSFNWGATFAHYNIELAKVRETSPLVSLVLFSHFLDHGGDPYSSGILSTSFASQGNSFTPASGSPSERAAAYYQNLGLPLDDLTDYYGYALGNGHPDDAIAAFIAAQHGTSLV